MANCNCVKGNFDIIISHLSCGTLLIEDMSDWMQENGIYQIPESYTLTVISPNRTAPVNLTVFTNKRNKYIPSDLGISAKNFNDGIYCFKLDNCGNLYTRNKLLSCSIECCIEDAVAKIKNREEILLLDEVKMLLDSSKINTEIGNLTKAKEQYRMVTKMLKRLNCSCS